MSGKIVGAVILLSALLAGGALYYLQVYGFYREIAASEAPDVVLVSKETGAPETIAHSGLRAVDANSSPIRFRACFQTDSNPDVLVESYVVVEDVTPRNAPGWFDCFDARGIAGDLEQGTARAFLGQKNIRYGVDRIVAITTDGRGFIWHELNACGEKAYDGTVVGEECPARPEPGR